MRESAKVGDHVGDPPTPGPARQLPLVIAQRVAVSQNVVTNSPQRGDPVDRIHVAGRYPRAPVPHVYGT
jgi:hypothetical protein